jgi:hypothetical protein
MIKLITKGLKIKSFSNKKGMEILQRDNPTEEFRIAICEHTNKKVVQNWHKTDKFWLCLHD